MSKNKKKIAVIGSGAAGLAACYFLKDKFDLLLLEKNNRFGGHVNTIEISPPCLKNKNIPVDTGFIVCNDLNYPVFNEVMKQINISPVFSDMSFSYLNDSAKIFYASHFPSGILNNGNNLLQKWFWYFLKDLLRFKKVSQKFLKENNYSLSLYEFLIKNNFSNAFVNYYVLPMGAAIWSLSIDGTKNYPAYSFLKFWVNHCLFNIIKRPQWKTIEGGAKQYVDRILSFIPNKKTNVDIKYISRENKKISLHTNSDIYTVDKLIFACHADQILDLLEKPSESEKQLFSTWKYTKNKAILHYDDSFMPKNKHLWSSWITTYTNKNLNISYWMNKLQPLACKTPIFVSLNPNFEIDRTKIFKEINYAHPYFDTVALNSQSRINSIQGENDTYFCGSYLGFGFHEDAFRSAKKIASQLIKNEH